MGRDLMHHDTLNRTAQALSAAYSGVSSSAGLQRCLLRRFLLRHTAGCSYFF
jgi:hypothetical protein